MSGTLPQSPKSPARRWAAFAAKAAVSVIALYLVLRGVDLTETLSLMAASRKLPWFAAFLLMVLSQVLSTFRWQILLRPLGFALPWPRVFSIYFVGMFFSLFLPSLVGGDAVKTFYVAGTWRRAPAALYTLLADRALGLAAQQVYTVIGLFLLGAYLPGWLTASLAAFVALAYAVLCWLPRMAGPLLALSRRLRELPREVLFTYWHDPLPALRAWAISLAIHLCLVLAHVLLGYSLGLAVTPAAFLVIYPVSAVVAFIPVSLNGIGLREAAYVYLLSLFGVPVEVAFSFGVMWFTVVLANGALGGVPYLFGGSLKVEEGHAV